MDSIYGIKAGLVAVALSFAICAFFRMMQLGIVRSRSQRLRELGRKNKARWKYARLVRVHAGRSLFVCQTGFFFGSLWLGLSVAAVAHRMLPFEVWGARESAGFLMLSLAVLLAASVPLLLLQLCRAIAFNFPERLLLNFGSTFMLASVALSPCINAIDFILEGLVKLFGLEYPCERQIAVPGEELREIVEASTEAGELEEEEKEMIRGVFLIADTSIKEVMTPRVDIVSISIDASLSEILSRFLEDKLSRILVCGESLDDVRGVVHAKDLLPLVGKTDAHFTIQSVMRPACMVPGSKKVDEVLQELRSQAIHFAVVLDEHGGVDGVVTVEDLLEEIVGEIFDEFDSPAEEAEVKRTKSGDYLIEGSLSVADFNQRFNAHLEEGEYDTIAGFLIHKLSRMPQHGELVDCNHLRIRVEEIDDNRITQLRVLRRRRPTRQVRAQNHESKPLPPESKNFEVHRQARVVTR